MIRRAISRPAYKPKVGPKEKNRESGEAPGDRPLKGISISGTTHQTQQNKTQGSYGVDELLAQAKSLTPKDRQELLDQLALAAQMTRKADADRDLDMWSAAVYEALLATPGDREAGSYGQLVVKRLLGASSIWRPIQEFMDYSKLSELKVAERQSVYMMLAELLVKHARQVSERSGVPLGPKLVGNCTNNIRGVFEQSFPGYIRAGLAKIAARQLTTRRA